MIINEIRNDKFHVFDIFINQQITFIKNSGIPNMQDSIG